MHVIAPDQLNTYDVLVSDDVVFTEGALTEFVDVASGDVGSRSSAAARQEAREEGRPPRRRPAATEAPPDRPAGDRARRRGCRRDAADDAGTDEVTKIDESPAPPKLLRPSAPQFREGPRK